MVIVWEGVRIGSRAVRLGNAGAHEPEPVDCKCLGLGYDSGTMRDTGTIRNGKRFEGGGKVKKKDKGEPGDKGIEVPPAGGQRFIFVEKFDLFGLFHF